MKYSVTLHIAGGKLANGVEFNITVEFDFTGLSLKQCHALLIDSSSPRVKLATRLRSMGVEKLKGLEANGYKCLVSDLGIRAIGQTQSAGDILMKMDKPTFISWMVENIPGVDAEAAEKVYNKKHGIVVE